MEFRGGGIPLSSDKDHQVQGSWIPVTPVKPVPTKPTPILGVGHGNQSAGRNWLDLPGFYSNGLFQNIAQEREHCDDAAAVTALGSLDYMERVGDLDCCNSAIATQSLFSDHHVSSFSPINGRQQQFGWGNMLLANQNFLLSTNQWNSPPQTSEYGFPIPYNPTFDLNSPPKTIANAVLNGTISSQLAPVTPDQGKRLQNSISSENIDLNVDERTREKDEDTITPPGDEPSCKQAPSKLVNLTSDDPLEETQNPDDNGEDHGIDLNKTPQQKPKRRRKHRPKVVIEGKSKQRTPKPVTPKQDSAKEKPTRKRKYVRKNSQNASATQSAEGETVDLATGTKVKSCKRALDFSSEAQPSVDGASGNISCRGTLDFNSENRQQNGCVHDINNGSGTKSSLHLAQGLKVVVENSPAGIAFDLNRSLTKLLDDYIALPENPKQFVLTRKALLRENIKVLARKGSNTDTGGVCVNGGDNSGHSSMQHVHVKETECMINPTERVPDSHGSTVPSKLQRGPRSLHFSGSLHVPLTNNEHPRKESKREYSRTVEEKHLRSVDPIESHSNLMWGREGVIQDEHHGNSSIHILHFPDIYKKKRTEKAHNELTKTSSSVTSMDYGLKQVAASSENEVNTNNPLTLQNGNGEALTHFTMGRKMKYKEANTACDMRSSSKEGGHSGTVKNISEKVFLCDNAQRTNALYKLQAPMGILAFGQIERKTKKRSKGPVRVRNLASLTGAAECNQLPPKMAPRNDVDQGNEISRTSEACMLALASVTSAKTTKKKRTKKEPTHTVNSTSYYSKDQVCQQERDRAAYGSHRSLEESRHTSLVQKSINVITASTKRCHASSSNLPTYFIRNCQSTSNFQEKFHADFSSQQIVPYMNPMDEIVLKLSHLSISKGKIITGQEQNALVPYSRDGKMVPFEGPFNLIKRRRPRPKVDLDEETHRVWKLLMGKEASKGDEGTGEDKEKWWEEERRVFQGRADSFIARMHLVQGDRRFSRWKGSVVDSVVGVFLTQNVSDHLSSSAFMSLAARFPLESTSNHRASDTEETSASVVEQEVCILDFDQRVSDHGSMTLHEEREMTTSNESFGSNMGAGTAGSSKDEHSVVCKRELEKGQESPSNIIDTPMRVTKSVSSTEADRRMLEDAVSSQNSANTSIQIGDQVGLSSESNSETVQLITGHKCIGFDGSTSFMELLQMAGANMFRRIYNNGYGSISFKENFEHELIKLEGTEFGARKSSLERLGDMSLGPSICASNSQLPNTSLEFKDESAIHSGSYHLPKNLDSGSAEVDCVEVLRQESRSPWLSTASEMTEIIDSNCISERIDPTAETALETTVLQEPSSVHTVSADHSYAVISKSIGHLLPTSDQDAYLDKCLHSCNNIHGRTETSLDASNVCSEFNDSVNFEQKARQADFQSESTGFAEPRNLIRGFDQLQNSIMEQAGSNMPNSGETLDVESTIFGDKEKSVEGKVVESSSKEQVCNSENGSTERTSNVLKAKKRKGEAEKRKAFDWDSLRKQACCNGPTRERSHNTMDSIDWEAVRCAEVGEIANTIKERGMNNMLAERIKDFLNRLVRDHGSIDLEWLRDVPPDKAKDYLLSVRGLGLKSVECVRLLTLHHLAFPVDTNVGRICVRLGWVPIQPLPESLQLHLLELYPVQESIQKYLWPRLCKLDQRTLYELHYQMITFGKVFCTKSKPNCNACPMRGECKHFASAFASARLSLPAPEEKSLVSSVVPFPTKQNHKVANLMSLPDPPKEGMLSQAGCGNNKSEPIIEEPATPEPECIETSESAIEDTFYEDPDEIPTIKLNFEEFTLNLQNYMQENKVELQGSDMSKALVALTPEAASIPTPKLKNVSRLRTEHQVYELPDSHPLLQGLDQREPDDPCSYLLAIWTPGETAQSIEPPEIRCSYQGSGNLCDQKTCFSCNSIREANTQTVRGTLLIPCRTAMRGSFPLNGTYFQVNEVFADHDSSLQPIDVPREWIWNLPRRTVYFGTSIPTIFRGLTTEGIQYCFWRGFVCVRGFDQKTRAPRPLMARLHFPASKLPRMPRTKKTPPPTKQKK